MGTEKQRLRKLLKQNDPSIASIYEALKEDGYNVKIQTPAIRFSNSVTGYVQALCIKGKLFHRYTTADHSTKSLINKISDFLKYGYDSKGRNF